MRKLNNKKGTQASLTPIRAVDFFCGGGGMTYGFRQAGIEIIAGIDNDLRCKETYEVNNPTVKFIHADVKNFTEEQLIEKTGISKNDDNLVFIGCSPCQYWSIIKTDKKKSEDSKNLLNDFSKFVAYFKPGFVVIENVPGIFSKSESPLKTFISFLADNGYDSRYQIIKVSEYGVPQTRKRFVLIASRLGSPVFPQAESVTDLTVRKFIGDKIKFPEIIAGHTDETDFCHTASGLKEVNLKRLEMTPKDGGTRSAWRNTDLQLKVYHLKDNNDKFGFEDTYGRLFWDKLSSTITTKFFGISHGRFAHPEQNRAISIREAATLQTFPLDYVFKPKNIADKARLIGNAVPPELARRIASSLISVKGVNDD